MSKYPILLSFYIDFNKFNILNPQKNSVEKEKKATVYDNASELSSKYLERYFDEYKAVPNAKKKTWVTDIIQIYFLKHIIVISGLNMKNQLMQQEKVIKKNL